MSYKIKTQSGIFADKLKEYKPKLIVADENVFVDYKNTEYLQISEKNKTFDLYFAIIDIFEKYQINRNDIVFFVGGGVLIDVASFAASTYKRGIDYVNVPTTTLSMIDSSVGSKNGLNYNNQKNLIGTFNDPLEVVIDIDFLKTLDERNYNNGLAEAIKIGFLSNELILDLLEEKQLNIQKVISLSIAEKLKYVEADKFDKGYRNNLNFGHTFGHGLESVSKFESLLHGEAVSIGMVIASGYNPRLIKLLEKYKLPTKIPKHISIEEMVNVMRGDKKNTSDLITVILKNPQLKTAELTPKEVIDLIDKSVVIKNRPFSGSITVNKSKSHIHRLLAATLAMQAKISFDFNAENDLSDDVKQTINILKNVGVKVKIQDGQIIVDATSIHEPKSNFYIYKSATTYRIFAPILCSLFESVSIELDEQLKSRPHTIFDPFKHGDIHTINLADDHFELDGSVSSQFISGYIFAIIAKQKVASITIVNEITSKPYIDMTIEVARQFGVEIRWNQNKIDILNYENVYPTKVRVEPDFSSLGYFEVYNHLCSLNNIDNQLKINDHYFKSNQADSILPTIIENNEVDMTDCPDLLPTLVVLGLLNKRGLKLTNTSRIKFKECDRINAMIDNLSDLNAIKKENDSLIISPVDKISGRLINTFGDHRIAMAFTIMAPFCNDDIIIDNEMVVNKSFPTFFKQLVKE